MTRAPAPALLGLPCTVRDAVAAGTLAPSVAHEASEPEDPDARREVAARVVAGGPSRAEAVEAVREVAGRPGAGGPDPGR